MSNYFILTRHTISPADVTVIINNGASYATVQNAILNIDTTDAVTTGYQMKIWGDIIGAVTVETANWEAFTRTKEINLTPEDGLKTINVIVSDDVLNQSEIVSATIILDMTSPVITTTVPSVNRISTQINADTAEFSFMVNEVFTDYTVRVVPTSESLHTTGVQIPTTNGSINMSGTNVSGFPADTPIYCTIRGADLAVASPGDGKKIIKVFVQDKAGHWSVA